MSTCTIDGCEGRLKAKGYCLTHYMRVRRQGTPADPAPETMAERFWSKVQQQPEGCWEWTASRNHLGYGIFSIERRARKAHRVSFELTNGSIPEGLDIDHICRNRGCVNPSHLRTATAKQNGENLSGATKSNVTSGVRGVYKSKNRWQARVSHNGEIYTAGTHTTIAEAEAAVITLRNQLFTHNNLDRQQQGS